MNKRTYKSRKNGKDGQGLQPAAQDLWNHPLFPQKQYAYVIVLASPELLDRIGDQEQAEKIVRKVFCGESVSKELFDLVVQAAKRFLEFRRVIQTEWSSTLEARGQEMIERARGIAHIEPLVG